MGVTRIKVMKEDLTRREFLQSLITWGVALPFSFSSSVFAAVPFQGQGGRAPTTRGPEGDSGLERFFFTQLKYRGGDWDPHPRAFVPLIEDVIKRTSVEASLNRRITTVLQKDFFSYPFLYMAGREEFDPFSEEEVEMLRRFLTYGGILFADDASGYKGYGFDKSFRRELKKIFPDRQLERLPSDHTVFRSFYLVTRLGGRKIVNPFLEGIEVEDRTPVIYCQNDLGGAWEKDMLGKWLYECEPGGEAQRFEAFKLGVNIVLYALTVNYKKDQIHLPFIKRKLG
ncbi:MAG: DUF4159 domain-containing protein [Candidatus Tectomicrobia bacterium]|nr:DUF4159 domain-containing protein [Candidatus Tectomicrobia bacterium]